MSLDSVLGLVQTALELGLISSLTVLALFLSYSMLGVCDLSTDGCFTFGRDGRRGGRNCRAPPTFRFRQPCSAACSPAL